MTNKQIEKVQGAILSCFESLHFLQECKHLGVFRNKTKLNLKRTFNDLLEIETKYFNEIDKIDDNNLADKLVANKLEFIDYMLTKFDYSKYTKMLEVAVAFELNEKRLTSISDKILLENGGNTYKNK